MGSREANPEEVEKVTVWHDGLPMDLSSISRSPLFHMTRVLLEEPSEATCSTSPSLTLVEEVSEKGQNVIGGVTWPSARVLASAIMRDLLGFEEEGKWHPLISPGARVLELGAGTGLPGMACFFFKGCSAVLTERPDVLRVTLKNVEVNKEQFRGGEEPPLVGRILEAAPFDWGSPSSFERIQSLFFPCFDVILGADILYFEEQDPLMSALSLVTQTSVEQGGAEGRGRGGPVVVLAYKNRTSEDWAYLQSRLLPCFQILNHLEKVKDFSGQEEADIFILRARKRLLK